MSHLQVSNLIFPEHKTEFDSLGGANFDLFKVFVLKVIGLFIKHQDGRYFLLLSLSEAEHLRSVMHRRHGLPLVEDEVSVDSATDSHTMARLWLLSDISAVIVGSSAGEILNSPTQQSAMVTSFRFLNSETHFDGQSLSVLLRVLDRNACDDREKWWTEVRACRRRRQGELSVSAPVRTAFTCASELKYFEHKAVVQRTQKAMEDKGMRVFDAFRSFNSSNSGTLNCSELYGGLEHLDLRLVPDQIYDLMNRMAEQQVGLASYSEFRKMFHTAEDEVESRGVHASGESSFEKIDPKPIPELHEEKKV